MLGKMSAFLFSVFVLASCASRSTTAAITQEVALCDPDDPVCNPDPGDEPPPPDPEPEPEVEEINSCCVCSFDPNENCDQDNEEDCTAADGKFCVWRDGECIPDDQNFCEQWIEAMECTQEAIVEEPSDGFPFEGCDAIFIQSHGHGDPEMCEQIVQLVEVCLEANPGCTEIDINIARCQVFHDLEAAQEHMEQIQDMLCDGTTCIISGHQCLMYPETCETLCTYTITPDCIEISPGPCNDGMACELEEHGDSALCTDEDGNDTHQLCCCDEDENCSFIVGADECP